MSITFIIEDGTERLSSHSGLTLIGALLDDTRLKDRLSQVTPQSCLKPEISHSDVVCSMIGLLCLASQILLRLSHFGGDLFLSRV